MNKFLKIMRNGEYGRRKNAKKAAKRRIQRLKRKHSNGSDTNKRKNRFNYLKNKMKWEKYKIQFESTLVSVIKKT